MARARKYPTQLIAAERALDLPQESLEGELMAISRKALSEDWALVYEHLTWPDSTKSAPYLKWSETERYRDGRLGIDFISPWKPGVFIGVLTEYDDSRLEPSSEFGADFVLIVDVMRKDLPRGKSGVEFMREQEFVELRFRVTQDADDWHAVDHRSQGVKANQWHPIYLRKPLAKEFGEATSVEDRYQCWLESARSALHVLLRGGEIQALRDRLKRFCV